MFGVGSTELLILGAIFLLLFGFRRIVSTARWVCYELTGNTRKAREAEVSVGRQLANSLLLDMPLIQESRATRLVAAVANRLATVGEGARRRFEVRVVHSRRVNAFVLPGGFVLVTDSLLQLCRYDKDETAFIVAHEMAHQILGHARDRLLGSLILSALARLVVGGGGLSRRLRRMLTRAMTSAYSQDQELEADRKGARLLIQAGFDGAGAVRFFRKLQQLAPAENDVADTYFSSHPPWNSRTAAIAEVLD